MNKLSGLGIMMFVFSLWMAIWSSPKDDIIGLWISILMLIFGGMLFIISLPMK